MLFEEVGLLGGELIPAIVVCDLAGVGRAPIRVQIIFASHLAISIDGFIFSPLRGEAQGEGSSAAHIGGLMLYVLTGLTCGVASQKTPFPAGLRTGNWQSDISVRF